MSIQSIQDRAAQTAIRGLQEEFDNLESRVSRFIRASVLDHFSLKNIGTNTHAQIDTALSASTTHIASTSNPHSVTLEQAITAGAVATSVPTFSRAGGGNIILKDSNTARGAGVDAWVSFTDSADSVNGRVGPFQVLGSEFFACGNIDAGGLLTGFLVDVGADAIGLVFDGSDTPFLVAPTTTVIDATGTEALLVRKDGNAGDVFLVDTTNSHVIVGPGTDLQSNVADAASAYAFSLQANNAFTSGTDRGLFRVLDSSSNPKLSIFADDTIQCAGGIFTYDSALDSTIAHRFDRTRTEVLSGSFVNLQFTGTFNPQTGGTPTSLYGMLGTAILDDITSPFTGTVTNLIGAQFTGRDTAAGMNVNNVIGGKFLGECQSGIGTVTTLSAAHFQALVTATPGTITTVAVCDILAPTTKGGSLTITNWNGIRVRDQKAFGNTTYAIKVDTQTSAGNGFENCIFMAGGDWDDGHFTCGVTHWWQDHTNNIFRIKNSTPSSTTQGVGFGDAGETGAQTPTLSANLPAAAAGTASATWWPVWIGATKGWVPVWQ